MHLKAILLGLVVSGLTCGTSSAQVVWSDEFNGDSIDRTTWTYDVGGHGFGNGQLEFDTDRKENSYIENGKLVIEARRETYSGKSFTSARMLTQGRFAFQYGTLEARIKLPDTANGIWPAFWMLGNNFPAIDWPQSGEIDIVEIGGKDGIAQGLQRRKINCALHFAGADGNHAINDAWLDARVDLNRDYHLYRVTWTPTHLKFYLDGVEFGSFDISADQYREFHQPFFPILNVAVGGRDPSYTGVYKPEAVTAPFPAKMYVDWIRLTRNSYTKLYLGKDLEENGKFGVYTEQTRVHNALAFENGESADFPFGSAAALYLWNNMAVATKPGKPSEGKACWSFDIGAADWFGMGVFVPGTRNMNRYSDGFLHFDIKTASNVPMKVGIKSSRGGEFFLQLGDDTAEFGFARDNQWHEVVVPLNRFANVDFRTVHQLFMIAGDPPDTAVNLSIDNVWWEPGAPKTDTKEG